MRVEQKHGVVIECLELLLAQTVQCGDEGNLSALVDLHARLRRQHDGRDMREHAGSNNLTHDYSFQPFGAYTVFLTSA